MTREVPAPRFLNRPLALLPNYRSLVLYPDDTGSRTSSTAQGAGLVGNVAVISVSGCLVHGASYGFSGMAETLYAKIGSAFAAALDADDVDAIVLHVDSPGGEVSSCADLADAIYAARGIKPIHAIVDDLAASAAYWLASAADRIVVSRTGMVGSVGVIAFHTDITRALDAAGVKITTLQFGARKSDGAPTTPLTSAAQKRMQADIDVMGKLFTQSVARSRGLRARDVRDFEAGTFLGRDAVRAGLADAVMSPDETFLELMDAATERPATRSAARAAQRRNTPGATRKKNPTMAAASDFAHLRPAAERTMPAKRRADALTFAGRVLAATAKVNGVPIPAAAFNPGPEQPKREQPKRRKDETSALGDQVAALQKKFGVAGNEHGHLQPPPPHQHQLGRHSGRLGGSPAGAGRDNAARERGSGKAPPGADGRSVVGDQRG